MVKVSIIIPAYNVGMYVVETVDSVLCQSRLPYEIIIVDDGSSDDTSLKLKQYEGNTLVRIFRTRNRGLGPARNFGLQHASGDYVYFLDADDLLSVNFLENIERIVVDNCFPDIVFFSGQSFVDEGVKANFFPDYGRKLVGFFHKEDFYVRKMYKFNSFFSSACLYIAKNSLYKDNKLKFRKIVYEDEEIIFPLICLANTAYVDDSIYFNRRIRAGSIMMRGKTKKNVSSSVFILKSLLFYHRLFKNNKYYDCFVYRKRIIRFVKRYIRESFVVRSDIDFKFVMKCLFSYVFLK